MRVRRFARVRSTDRAKSFPRHGGDETERRKSGDVDGSVKDDTECGAEGAHVVGHDRRREFRHSVDRDHRQEKYVRDCDVDEVHIRDCLHRGHAMDDEQESGVDHDSEEAKQRQEDDDVDKLRMGVAISVGHFWTRGEICKTVVLFLPDTETDFDWWIHRHFDFLWK